jgi:hypothetical protein
LLPKFDQSLLFTKYSGTKPVPVPNSFRNTQITALGAITEQLQNFSLARDNPNLNLVISHVSIKPTDKRGNSIPDGFAERIQDFHFDSIVTGRLVKHLELLRDI